MQIIKWAGVINPGDFNMSKTVALKEVTVVQAEYLVPDHSVIKIITAQGQVLTCAKATENDEFNLLVKGLAEMIEPFKRPDNTPISPAEQEVVDETKPTPEGGSTSQEPAPPVSAGGASSEPVTQSPSPVPEPAVVVPSEPAPEPSPEPPVEVTTAIPETKPPGTL